MQCYKNGQLIDSIPLLDELFIMAMVALPQHVFFTEFGS